MFFDVYILELLSFETLTFSDVTLSDINVVWCYVLSLYPYIEERNERRGMFYFDVYFIQSPGGVFAGFTPNSLNGTVLWKM